MSVLRRWNSTTQTWEVATGVPGPQGPVGAQGVPGPQGGAAAQGGTTPPTSPVVGQMWADEGTPAPGNFGALDAVTQTWLGQQIIKRPSASVTTPILMLTDEQNRDRFSFAIIDGTATQFQVYGETGAPAIVGLVAPNGTDYADFTFDGNNADIDVQGGDLNLRPLTATHNVNVWGLNSNVKLRVGSQNFGQSLDISHDGTNAHINPTAGFVGLQGDKFQILASGAVNYTGPTAAAASAGNNGALPATVGGYLTWQVGGTTVKVPYFLA